MKKIILKNKAGLSSFIYVALIALILSTIFWASVVFYYFEMESRGKVDQMVQTERERVKEKVHKLNLTNKEVAAIISRDLKESMKRSGAVGLVITRDNQEIINIIESEVPKDIQEKFKKSFFLENGFREGIILPSRDKDLYFIIRIQESRSDIKVLIKLDKNTKLHLQEDIKEAIAIAVISILFTNLLMFPIFYRQYKKLQLDEQELLQSNLSTLNALGNAVSKRDSDTDEHNYRVTFYSINLAEKIGLEKDIIRGLIKGAFLHDVGKIGVSDTILLKPGKLTEEEFEVMKTHVNHGVEIVQGINWLDGAKKVIESHHEKYDGTGYPNGLKGKEIPIEARVFAVVDVFDALTSKRPYKEPFTVSKSLEIIEDGFGSHFDEKIAKEFSTIAEDLHVQVIEKTKQELEEILSASINRYYS